MMFEPAEQQYVTIGHVAQSHGVDGVVLIIPELNLPDLFDGLRLVRLKNNRGDLVPARIASVRVQEKNNRRSFFVKFDHIKDRNEADTLKGFSVCVERGKIPEEPARSNEQSLIGYTVHDGQNQTVGTVQDVMDNSAQHILVVETQDGRLLVPFVDEYIEAKDDQAQTIHGRNLDQLTNL